VVARLAPEHTIAIFVAQLILLLFFGRVLGELMSRVGQPAIFGQLLAGVLLGPSVFGALLPTLRAAVFPDSPVLKSMIDAISQIGILLLLLLTGMETNLALMQRRRRTVISTSLIGIAVPFVFGMLLAYTLPDKLIPTPAARVVPALFLGTALSISSVKIVAMVLMEVGAMRRDLGQLILATAILDDTIAWVIIAVIAGIAAHGAVNLTNVAGSVGLTALFLALSLTVGRRLVARIIRLTNDNMTIEVPVITGILLVMLVMALLTELIGVHTALGAFVAGILVGQSPILTEHIESELRGFIFAFFSPVFFAVAGLGMDVRTLLDPTLFLCLVAVILVASVGKFLGALAGGRLGGLTFGESVALATGLNARGSTEVIIASIGLAIGALSNQLYTMIVAMAVMTTVVMPPTLRWVLARVPLREEEERRLEREEAEEHQTVPKVERVLVVLDRGPNATLAALLAGLFCAQQQALATVMTDTDQSDRDANTGHAAATLTHAATLTLQQIRSKPAGEATPSPQLTVEELIRVRGGASPDAVEAEAVKGYNLAFVGLDQPIRAAAAHFNAQLERLIEGFSGPVAIALNEPHVIIQPGASLDILVPTGGTPEARLALEIAIALAKASQSRVTALHVIDPQEDMEFLRGRARRQGLSLLVNARRLGKQSGVPVRAASVVHPRPEVEIRRAARSLRHDLVVIGTSLRQGETKFLSPRSSALVRSLRVPMLLVAR
jgi:Kef-type K+ transport system membrane component KefB/nucleotide-binding universal stress UspA family protein